MLWENRPVCRPNEWSNHKQIIDRDPRWGSETLSTYILTLKHIHMEEKQTNKPIGLIAFGFPTFDE